MSSAFAPSLALIKNFFIFHRPTGKSYFSKNCKWAGGVVVGWFSLTLTLSAYAMVW